MAAITSSSRPRARSSFPRLSLSVARHMTNARSLRPASRPRTTLPGSAWLRRCLCARWAPARLSGPMNLRGFPAATQARCDARLKRFRPRREMAAVEALRLDVSRARLTPRPGSLLLPGAAAPFPAHPSRGWPAYVATDTPREQLRAAPQHRAGIAELGNGACDCPFIAKWENAGPDGGGPASLETNGRLCVRGRRSNRLAGRGNAKCRGVGLPVARLRCPQKKQLFHPLGVLHRSL